MGLGGRVVVLWWVLYGGEGFYVTLVDSGIDYGSSYPDLMDRTK